MAEARPRTGPRVPPQRAAAPPAEGRAEYRIDDLAREAGTTARNVRAYQDRGLLPRPDRRGRANVYGPAHLERLRLISQLLDRGHTLAGIKELIDAWENGTGLGGVLGLAAEVAGPWSDESAAELSRAELTAAFGHRDDEAVEKAVRLGVLEPVGEDRYRVPSPALIRLAAELHADGAPLGAIIDQLVTLRADLDGIAQSMVRFSATHLFAGYAGHPLSDHEAAEILSSVRRLRPLAQQAMEAELARALRAQALHLLNAALANEP
ncbi:MerR family transcriptional regulator [Phaeacidiphilus oryzae]|jgi:DNA-binding transcriptional MerR regulator|uniref:MerR family transcriptional regulator n=1 Tax=Phaeacidiphilus oryzae TaxID=348818 RepID=UPI0006920E54